jgi:vacuolar-type H+-ATPase subunit C/Vma6
MLVASGGSNRLLHFFCVTLLAFALGGCAVKWVDSYDAVAFEEILSVGKAVDKFYGKLLETQPDARAYRQFVLEYVAIESDIQSMLTRNRARALNEESTQIAESILKLWVKYKEAHKSRDAYSDGNAKLDRSRFTRLFAAAASAEQAKKLDADDRDSSKDSQ